MNDNSEMPYGKYKGEKLINVPRYYLVWLYGKINEKSRIHWKLTDKLLHKYINENINKTNNNTAKKQ